MAVRLIRADILSERFDESRAFSNDVIGLEGGDGLDWISFFGTEKREVRLSVMKLDIRAHLHPDVSIEVDDVDAVYGRARAAGAEIVYPTADEVWGLRRFFVRDPTAQSSTSPSTRESGRFALAVGSSVSPRPR